MGGLDEMAAALRQLGEDFEPEAIRRAQPHVEASLKASAAAGTTPDGAPWAPKKTGGRAMPNAARAISVKAFPTVLRVVLEGVEVFGHFGKGAMQVARKIIPDTGTIPKLIVDGLKRGADEAFERLMQGGAR